MNTWKKGQGYEFKNSAMCWGEEFNADETRAINIAHVSVRGAFPEKGWGYNEEAHEMIVVTGGEGSVQKKGEDKCELAVGDVVHFSPGERVRWEGELDLVIACSPAFDPSKHHIEE